MEAIRRRVDKEKPLVDISYQQSAQNPKTEVFRNSAIDYKNDLLLAVIPLITILLTFGGRISVLVMCFGGLICYIFDLVGSVEVNIEQAEGIIYSIFIQIRL